MKLQILSVIIIFTFFGCVDGQNALKEQTQIQADQTILAENQNLEMWSSQLSSDLSKKRAFINAVEGEYEGQFSVKATTYRISLLVTATIPDYGIHRVRTIAELEYDLQNLNLNIQIKQWNPNSQRSAVGCVLENIKADYKKGLLNLISENCPNTYQLFLYDEETFSTSIDNLAVEQMKIESSKLAKLIENRQLDYVLNFKGKLRSNTNSQSFNFILSRI